MTGNIKFDDIEIKDINANSLYKMIFIIQQNVFIFDAPIIDNYNDTRN